MAAMWSAIGCVVGSLATAFALVSATAGEVAAVRTEVAAMRNSASEIVEAVDELNGLLSGLRVSADGGDGGTAIIFVRTPPTDSELRDARMRAREKLPAIDYGVE